MAESDPSDRPQPQYRSARASARRPMLGRLLLVMAVVLGLAGIGMAIFAPWSELRQTRNQMQKRLSSETPMRFVVPGEATLELPAGKAFVSYLTDTEWEGTRFITSSELVFELTVTDPAGDPIAVEFEPTHRANLPSSRPGRSATAVLVGAVDIPETGLYDVKLVLGEKESSQAVADVFVVQEAEAASLERALGPVIGSICGLGGAVVLAILGGITIWLEKRAAMAFASPQ